MKNIINKILIVALLLVTLTGCGVQPQEGQEELNQKVDTSLNNENNLYPIEYTDAMGNKILIENEPVKIISLAPNMTESIFAIGKGDILVGRTEYCTYPEAALQVPTIGSIMEPNIEKIVEIMPDLVFASSIVPLEAVEQLRSLGIQVVSMKNEESFDSTYNTILDLGYILGAQEQADLIVKEMQEEVKYITEKVSNAPKVSTYYVIAYGEYGDYTPGGGTFINDVITMAGGINIASDMEGWKYSKEKLIEQDPDIIIIRHEDLEGFKNTDGYKELRAVKENNVKGIDAALLEIQSTRISKGLSVLAQLLHPELF